MTSGDKVVLAVVLLVALAAWPLAGSASGSGGRTEVVIQGPDSRSQVPLDVDRTIRVRGMRGIVTVAVEDGRVRVSDADCPDQLCVHQGAMDDRGALVCAPNGVSVWIGGDTGHAPDAIVR